MPRVAVLITAYNAEATIRQAMLSVDGLPFNDHMIYVVDDCSIDSTAAVIEPHLAVLPIEYLRTPQNLHIAGAANFGLRHIDAEFIFRLDSDDFWQPGHGKRILKAMEADPELLACGAGAEFIEAGKQPKEYHPPKSPQEILAWNVWSSPMVNSSVCIRQAALREYEGPYTDRFRNPPMEDWELWVKLGLQGKLMNLKHIGCTKRVHSKSGTALGSGNRTASLELFYRWVADAYALPAMQQNLDVHLKMHTGCALTAEDAAAFKDYLPALQAELKENLMVPAAVSRKVMGRKLNAKEPADHNSADWDAWAGLMKRYAPTTLVKKSVSRFISGGERGNKD